MPEVPRKTALTNAVRKSGAPATVSTKKAPEIRAAAARREAGA